MIEGTTQVFDIQNVRAVQCPNGSVAITFQSGLVAWLPSDHPEHDRILHEVECSSQWGRPVGVLVNGDGRLLELSHTHDTSVHSVQQDEEGKSRLAVSLWGCSPVCYLTLDHPEFDRIRATLEQAIATGTRVWLANHMHVVEGEFDAPVRRAVSDEPRPDRRFLAGFELATEFLETVIGRATDCADGVKVDQVRYGHQMVSLSGCSY
jgi:hypothetical protein